MNTLQIPVKTIPNFWGGDPITVQWGVWEDGEFEPEECNHAGATIENEVQTCNKPNCNAWRFVFDYDFPTPTERWRYE